MSGLAEAVRAMRENGGEPYGILCAGKDRAAMEAHGMPVRVSTFVPDGQAYIIGRKEWEEMRTGAPPMPLGWLDWEAI